MPCSWRRGCWGLTHVTILAIDRGLDIDVRFLDEHFEAIDETD